MSVSVSAFQLKILVVAILVVTAGQFLAGSIDAGQAARASIVEPLAEVFNPAQMQSAQPPARPQSATQVLRYKHPQRPDPDTALANIATLADTYEVTRMSPMGPSSQPSLASATKAGLVTLFGTGLSIVIGICGLIAFKSRRQA